MNCLFRVVSRAAIVLGVALAGACSAPTQSTSPLSPLPTSPLLAQPVFAPTGTFPASTAEPPLTATTTPVAAILQPTTLAPDFTPRYTFQIVSAYPHDRGAFTQGLVFEDGVLYESTGLYGRSSLRRVDLETGQVLQRHDLPEPYFGEGIAIFGERIFQLTWQSHVGFVYDRQSLERIAEFFYPTEGWGLTHDGVKLIMSDGTATLYFLDPVTLATIGQLEVKVNADPVTRSSPPDPCFPWGRRTEVFVYGQPAIGLNELEYIQGEIYANVWQSNCIARIDAQTGQLKGWIELGGLLGLEDYSQPVDVLNGIAYDAENDRLFVTGKLWPKLFEIEVLPAGTRN